MKKILSIFSVTILIMSLVFSLSPITIKATDFSDIADGTYILRTALDTNKVMDIEGGNFTNETNILIYSFHGGDNQKFDIIHIQSGWYKIALSQSNKVIDVAGGKRGSGVNVQLYNYNGSNAQLWRFYSAGNGYYYIKNKLGNYLDVSGGSSADGTNIQVYQKNHSTAQKWSISKIVDNECKICSALDNRMCLDVYGNKNDNGTNIQLYAENNEDNQFFYIIHYKSGWYAIISKPSGKAIDVEGAKIGNEVNVQLYDLNWTDAQLWRFIDAGDGYYYIQNKLGYYLDVYAGMTQNETNVQVYEKNNGNNQKWKIIISGNQYYHDNNDSYYSEIKTLSFSNFSSWQKAINSAEWSIAQIATTPAGPYNSNYFIVDKQVLEWKTIQAKVSYNTPGYYQTIDLELPSKILYIYHKHNFKTGYGETIYFTSDSAKIIQTCDCGYRTEWSWEYPLDAFKSQASVSPKKQNSLATKILSLN